MKNIILGILVGLAIGGVATWVTLKHHDEKEPEKKEEAKEAKRVQTSTNGEVFLKLDKEAQERAGLKVAALESVESTPEIKGFGRVLDPAPLATQWVDITSAEAAYEASTKEYERLKVLHEQNQNVSTRALEAAQAAAKRDKILLEAAKVRLRLAWGQPVAERKDLPAFVGELISLKSAVIRIDLPLGQTLSALPSGARIAPVAEDQRLSDGEILGLATSADPQVQGQGFLFLVQSNSLLPGASVVGYLKVPGAPKRGVLVPNAALIRYEGEVFVYLQTSDDTFQREDVKLDSPMPNGWLVTTDLSAGQKVVITGAQELLSEELKSKTAEE